MPTIKDVAQLAGVGTTTVSRVINQSGPVHEDTKRRVLEAMKALDFRPHEIARGLRTNRLPTVGMIVSDISNPLFAEIVQAAHRVLMDKGYHLELGITNGNSTEETQLFQSFVRQGISGIIASLIDDTRASISSFLRKLPVPVVLLDRQTASPETNVVTNDHARGSVEAVDHLVKLGHRDIALILGSAKTFPGRMRKHAILTRLADHGLAVRDEYLHEVELGAAQGHQAMSQLLSLSNRPSAVIIGSNQAFVGALMAIRSANIAYPEDISIISYDDVPLTQLLAPPITIVNRNLQDFGTEAANLLMELIRARSMGARQTILPTWLEIRGSCGPPSPARR
ncbi:LacI family DNA-binding transcriptional regulator [Alicyclobacillus cycloheptanicus]|uniref:LacI family transcriptional regulator n=2 Tax=Alicyclobacillus cycloheptanicus TaxID=1457 RepID=A0ABT9XN60_9BACL|nr:LacI family DNA-binding transcriptional regulator [Alicyclobacillus cycloheptanicus]MDQ0191570.1 LacI family transcriptional regulator [Alicyclobacillus cycloheptanicus]WDM02429.1 LacI family DNA-binding transcriptional regulator [Alicyclobacillus cycloheptanicus]